jgi:HD-GYP domain-containing protein (c-di-GMP phosphodiesterase class II)
VVDEWDALISDRPYRNAWTRENVIAYLQENAGKIYDPEIVNVFLTII